MINNKKTVINFISLASVQLFNYLLPLITMPYLILVLGIDNYGLVSFAQAVMQYFLLVTDYGFNISATQKISIHREDKEKVQQIYSTVQTCKVILMFLCLFLLMIMILLVPKLNQQPLLYLLMFGIVFGNIFFPVWLFQGFEEMKNIGILNFVSKLLFTVGLFLFVKNSGDIYKVAILNSLGYIMIGIFSVLIVRFHYKIKFVLPSVSEIKETFQSSWHLFISNISTSVYTTTNVFVLGLMVGNAATGYFNLANTLIRACASVVIPIVQTIYPRVVQIALKSKTESIVFIQKIWKVVTVLFFVGCCILLFASKPLLTILFQDKFDHSILLIQMMSFLPLMVAWGNIYGILTMTTFGYEKQLSKIYFVSGCISLVNILVFTYFFKELGTAFNAMLTETLVTLQMMYFLRKKKIYVSRGIIGGQE